MLISKNQLKVVAFASKEETRQALNGVNIRPNDNSVEATDGHSLMRVTNKSKVQLNEFPNVKPFNDLDENKMIPASAVNKLLKTMPSKKHNIPILNYFRAGLNGNKIDFTYTDLEDSQTLTAHITEGKYPNTDQVMPKEKNHNIKIALDAQKMAEICKYIASVSDDSSSMMVLHIQDKDHALLITAETENESIKGLLMPLQL